MFDYKQPKTTDSYRKGWEKAFSGFERDFINVFGHKPTGGEKKLIKLLCGCNRNKNSMRVLWQEI